MAKKQFQYDQDAESPWIPPVPRESRKEREVQPRRARDLAERLAALTAAERRELDIEEVLVDALAELDRIPSKRHAARKRKLGHIGGLVEGHDLDAIEMSIDDAKTGQTEREARIDALVRWRTRLLADPGELTAFIEAHPNTDRQRVRQLVSTARKKIDTPAGSKAARTLLSALKEAAGV